MINYKPADLTIRGETVADKVSEEKQTKTEKSDGALTKEAEKLLGEYQRLGVKHTSGEKFKVGEVLSTAAFVYEKIRNAIDYKGDHLLRRNAIERILKRLLWESPNLSVKTDLLAKTLVKELIWARYIQNESLSLNVINDISVSLERYVKVFERIGDHYTNRKEYLFWKNWFLGVASSEIESLIDPGLARQLALSSAMNEWFGKSFDWLDDTVSEEKEIHQSAAVHRSLFKLDLARIRYFLLRKHVPNWKLPEELDYDLLFESARNLEKIIQSDTQNRLYRYVQKFVAHFQILSQLVETTTKSNAKSLENKEFVEAQVREICERKYEAISKRVNTGITRSIIYIFATKVVFALMIEVPFEKYILGGIEYIPLIFNMVIPPLLMLVIGLSIRKPGEENTKIILERINDFLYDNDPRVTKFSVIPQNKNRVLYKGFMLFYFTIFLLTFGGITYLLYWLGYNPFGALIFYMFLSLVLLFGYRVKYNASELVAKEEKEGFVSHFVMNLSLPFLRIGLWLSEQVGRLNVLILVFDFLIEAPLKRTLKVVEEWTGFVKEQKEEVVDLPVK